MWDEFDNLYETLFDQSEYYLRIVEALAGKRIGLTRDEILTLTKLPDNGLTSNALKDLVKCEFLRVYQYYGRKNKTQTYQLADFYTLFYLQFIRENYGQDEHFWTHMLDIIVEQLDPHLFFLANRQYVVAHKAIESISMWFGGKLNLSLSVKVPERILISKARVPEFKEWYTA